jgi:hypothetical protein
MIGQLPPSLERPVCPRPCLCRRSRGGRGEDEECGASACRRPVTDPPGRARWRIARGPTSYTGQNHRPFGCWKILRHAPAAAPCLPADSWGRMQRGSAVPGKKPRSRCCFPVRVQLGSRHLANPNKFGHIDRVNDELGLTTPLLTTPLNYLSEDDPNGD